MNRLYAVEGVYSLTGAMADHRLRLDSRLIAPFLAALAARLGVPGAGSAPAAGVPGVDPPLARRAGQGPAREPGKSLIVAGDRQPAAVHALVCALNTHLGNTGKTVSVLRDQGCGASERQLADLARVRDEGGLDTDARRSGRQSCLRCPGRSRLRVGAGEGPSLDRARARGRRNLREGGVAHPRARTTSNRGETPAPSAARSVSSSR